MTKNFKIFVIVCLVIIAFVELFVSFYLMNTCVREHYNFNIVADERIYNTIKWAVYLIIPIKNIIIISVIKRLKVK